MKIKIKAIVIALLLVVNLGLLAAVVLSVVTERTARAGTAMAQSMPGSPRYLMVTGRYRRSEQALYVVNLERRMLAVFTFHAAKRRLNYSGRSSLAADFR